MRRDDDDNDVDYGRVNTQMIFFLFSHAHGTMREEWTKCVDWMKKNGNVPTHSKGPRCFGSHLKMTLAQVNLLFVHSLDSNFMFATPLIFSETHIVMEW